MRFSGWLSAISEIFYAQQRNGLYLKFVVHFHLLQFVDVGWSERDHFHSFVSDDNSWCCLKEV
jgi:hypothetical protein